MNSKLRIALVSHTMMLALAASAVLVHRPALAAEPVKGIEQVLATAQQEKKGVTLSVSGQSIGGGVVRIEAGQWVEMKSQQYGRIVVRLDRIDAVMMP